MDNIESKSKIRKEDYERNFALLRNKNIEKDAIQNN